MVVVSVVTLRVLAAGGRPVLHTSGVASQSGQGDAASRAAKPAMAHASELPEAMLHTATRPRKGDCHCGYSVFVAAPQVLVTVASLLAQKRSR